MTDDDQGNSISIHSGSCTDEDNLPSSIVSSFGNITIENSSKVHVGDKIYYNGPVTIVKQYSNESDEFSDREQLDRCDNFFGKVSIKGGKPVAVEDCIADDLTDISQRIVSQEEWLALKSNRPMDSLKQPVPIVIIAHTASSPCSNKMNCSNAVRNIQSGHLALGKSDIGYNFLVGGDGNIYVGRGWDKAGAHTLGHNQNSIGIAFIGNFLLSRPPQRQIDAAKMLIEVGKNLGKLASDYKLYFHKQLRPTESPGEALIQEIMTWPHWTPYES